MISTKPTEHRLVGAPLKFGVSLEMMVKLFLKKQEISFHDAFQRNICPLFWLNGLFPSCSRCWDSCQCNESDQQTPRRSAARNIVVDIARIDGEIIVFGWDLAGAVLDGAEWCKGVVSVRQATPLQPASPNAHTHQISIYYVSENPSDMCSPPLQGPEPGHTAPHP